jgi:hypothetical protein
LTKCSVGLFPREQIAEILHKLDRTITIRLLERLNVAWSTVFERYVSFLRSSFRVRLEMVLNGLGTRFGVSDNRGTLLVPELRHEDLAEMIGSSRPMVSQLIGNMIDEGLLVRSEKRHFILRAKQKRQLLLLRTFNPPSNGIVIRTDCRRVRLIVRDTRRLTMRKPSYPDPKTVPTERCLNRPNAAVLRNTG